MKNKPEKRRRCAELLRAEASVLMLACRRSIYKALSISLICCILQMAAFFIALGDGFAAPELVFAASHVGLIGAAGFAALCAALAMRGGAGGSKQDYTVRRLRISTRRVLVLGAIADGAMLLIFWAMQTLTLMALCQEFTVLVPESSSVQTVFLAFYRNSYLHGILPLADVGRWMRNIVMLPGLALCLSCFSARRRQGHWGFAAPFLAAVNIFTFSSEMGTTGADVAVILLTLCVTGGTVYGLWGDEYEEAA